MSVLKQLGAILLMAAMSLPLWAGSTLSADPAEVVFRSQVTGEKSVKIQLYNLAKEKTTLQVQNFDGKILFKQQIRNHNGYSLLLNLGQLPEGNYIIQVSQEDGAKAQVVRVNEDGLLLSKVVDEG